MKTVILAGQDNLVFSAADMINPQELKLVGYAVPMEEAWNIYDEKGKVLEDISDMPIMPLAAAVEFEPDMIITACGSPEDEEKTRFDLYRMSFTGEVFSLHEFFEKVSLKTSAIRKLAWRMAELGMEGAIADFGCGYGDISWQMNAMMPDRKLYLFDSQMHNVDRLAGRMPYPEMVEIRQGRFPDTAMDVEDEKYALVHMNESDHDTVTRGIQYFYPRLVKGGMIILSRYEDGKSLDVRQAVADLEAKHGAFLIVPLAGLDGAVVIIRP